MNTTPYNGTKDHRDIRTFFTSELSYLKEMRRRYACQFCGNSTMTCPACQDLNQRIKDLEGQADR